MEETKMVTVELFKGSKKIPSVNGYFEISIDGKITDVSGDEVTLDQFNSLTKCLVKSADVLIALTYQNFNWPPVYWKHLVVLKTAEGFSGPENMVLGITSPVESLEYPGFFMIPYYSNYVISETGCLLRKNGNREMTASLGALGYYTFRMTCDDNTTRNELRHRILCYAFKPYPANVEDLDVNHKNGVPGNDWLENLEWATRSENIIHAYQSGLRKDNRPVEVRDLNSGNISIFPSCSAAARVLGITETTVSNRAKTQGFKAFGGLQFRFYPNTTPWPSFESTDGKYLVEFPDKTTKLCDCKEAASLAGLTRTSLLRALREGRHYGTTENKITRISKSLPSEMVAR